MPKKYKHITLDDRTLIQTQLQQGFKPAAIAASLGRPPLLCHTRTCPQWLAGIACRPIHWAASHCGRLFFQPRQPACAKAVRHAARRAQAGGRQSAVAQSQRWPATRLIA